MSEHSDEMSYTFKPAGHRAPKQEREYPEPDRRLRSVFEKWLEEFSEDAQVDDMFRIACDAVKDLTFSLNEAHGLLVCYQYHPKFDKAGWFVSALYNGADEREIIFDLELATPPYCLGYRMAAGKVFVNLGNGGNYMCSFSSAPVINIGEVGNWMGGYDSAPIINLGNAGDMVGSSASAPVINIGKVGDSMGLSAQSSVINLGKAANDMGSYTQSLIIALEEPAGYGRIIAKLVLKPKDCEKLPELMEYLGSMKQKLESGRKDYRKVLAYLDSLGPEPGKKIEGDIKGILRRAGYDV